MIEKEKSKKNLWEAHELSREQVIVLVKYKKEEISIKIRMQFQNRCSSKVKTRPLSHKRFINLLSLIRNQSPSGVTAVALKSLESPIFHLVFVKAYK